MAGPLGSAAAGLANTAVSMPGVATAIGSVMPTLVAAAPYVALATAAAAVPGAVIAAANNEADRAIAVSRQFSPEVIGAEAQAGVRQVMADIRSARRLGDETGEIVESRSRIRTALQGIRDQVTEGVLQDVSNLSKLAATGAEGANSLLESLPDSVKKYGSRAAVAFLLNRIVPGLGTNLLAFSATVGSALPPPPQAHQGLVGIIPPTPNLPYPFTGKSEKVTDITTSGLPAALRSMGSY